MKKVYFFFGFAAEVFFSFTNSTSSSFLLFFFSFLLPPLGRLRRRDPLLQHVPGLPGPLQLLRQGHAALGGPVGSPGRGQRDAGVQVQRVGHGAAGAGPL